MRLQRGLAAVNKHAMHKNRKEDWETPPAIFEPINAFFGFTMDLAANKENALCEKWLGPGHPQSYMQDFLRMPARALIKYMCWINPPYGRYLNPFTKHIAEIADGGVRVVALLPAALETTWFHTYVLDHAFLYTRKGRIQFLYKGKRPMRLNKEGKLVPNSNTGANILACYGERPGQHKALAKIGWHSLS